jgi:hypothetical protein
MEVVAVRDFVVNGYRDGMDDACGSEWRTLDTHCAVTRH